MGAACPADRAALPRHIGSGLGRWDNGGVLPPQVPSVAAAAVAPGTPLLDVRQDDEWAAGHAPDAVHIPLAELPGRLGELPGGDVAVVCRSGGRSAQATSYLRRIGRSAVNVDGGMQAWAAAGRPMRSETAAPPQVI